MARWTRVAGIRTMDFGELRLSYVPDGFVHLKPGGWFPTATEQDWVGHERYLDEEGRAVASVGGLLVECGDRALLIDAGFGRVDWPDNPDMPSMGAAQGGKLLDSLRALGRQPADIEAVAITHIHPDHIGWAIEPELAFSNASYVFGETEWARRAEAAHVRDDAVATLEPFARTAAAGEEFFPGVSVLPTPGHTPGHSAYVLASGGQRMIAFGDAMHSPAQIAHPEWAVSADADPVEAVRSRQLLLAELRKPDTLGFGIHFGDAQFGRVVEARWQPI